MIENLIKIAGELKQIENPSWQDVGVAFYGKGYTWNHQVGDVEFTMIVKSTKEEIISLIEKPGILKHFECTPKGVSGFNHPILKKPYPVIHLITHIPYLSESIVREFVPEVSDYTEGLVRIIDGTVLKFPYNHFLEMEPTFGNPNEVYLDALDGVISLLQGLEHKRQPYWFYSPMKGNVIKGFPKGFRFQ